MALNGIYDKMKSGMQPLQARYSLGSPTATTAAPSPVGMGKPQVGLSQPAATTSGTTQTTTQPSADNRYQLSLDYAERNRNLLNSIRDQHQGEVYGGPSNVAALNDTSGVKLPSDMPDYYGLLSDHTGAQHDLFNDEAAAQAFLARARQADPSAHLVYGQQNGGGGEGGGGINEYYVDWDNSKLPTSVAGPASAATGHLANFGGYGSQDLFNQNMSVVDPHYGVLTDNRNINQTRANESTGIMRYAPMIVGAIATVMSGGAASPILIQMMSQAPQMIAQIASGANIPWESLVARLGASALGAPSWVASGAGYLAGAATSHGGKG